MRFNKQRSTLLIFSSIILILILLSIFNNNHTVDTSEMLINKPWEKEIVIENSDYIKHYLYSITGFYKELPWAIRISYTIIQISSLALIILLYLLFWDVHKRKTDQNNYQEIKSRFLGKLKEICTADKEYSEEQIKSELNINEETKFSYKHKLLLIDLFIELRMQISINPHTLRNLHNCIMVFDLQNFMEDRLISGKDSEKLKVIQAIRILHINATDSYVTRIINHRDKDLKKAARLYYIISNDDDPFMYMEGKNDNSFNEWDMMETHQIFEDCMNINKKLPSFIPAISNTNNKSTARFFIMETAYWGTEKEMKYLEKFLDSDDEILKKSTLESISLRKIKGLESKLKDIYYKQPEEIKRVILYTLLIISPEESVSFFKEAFDNTSSQLTKRMALQCMWKSGKDGEKAFKLLKETCNTKDLILFLHVENHIIEREKLSLHSIN